MKILFIVKGGKTPHSLSNSAIFTINFLKSLNVNADIAFVTESSQIENVINDNGPTHVIIESVFVMPIEFLRLTNMFKKVKWFIRLHSDIGFFFAEFYGLEWTKAYQNFDDITIAANNTEIIKNLSPQLKKDIIHLPNIYPDNYEYDNFNIKKNNTEINIGCFGNLRLVKNQGFQAVLAMNFADIQKKKLKFHINVGKSELRNNAVLTNLRALFKDSKHELVEHGWIQHNDFLKLIKTMDVGLQLSYTESFNIVACDFISCGIPILVSPTISWCPECYIASTIDMEECLDKLTTIYNSRNDIELKKIAIHRLLEITNIAKDIWKKFIEDQIPNKFNTMDRHIIGVNII